MFRKVLVKDLAIPHCCVAKMPAKPGEGVEVNLQMPAKQICKQFGDFVTYIFLPDTSESAPDDSTLHCSSVNAFALLAEGAKAQSAQVHLPCKKGVGQASVRRDW